FKLAALAALIACLLSSLGFASARAQTGVSGVFEIVLKSQESANAPNGGKVTLYQKSKALVIGMNGYDFWPQLSNGIRDAEEVAKALEAEGFEVTLKKDMKSDELDRTLKSFFVFSGDDPNARLLLWFAGHGHTIDGEGYIVPVDAPSPKADSVEFRAKAVSLRRFGEYMREARARHVLAIFDSCFSGSVFNVARSLPPPAITLATTQPVREFISSGEAEQQVSDDGTFRKLFLDALAGLESQADANHDGYITGTELGLFLQQKLTNLTNNRQTPRYGKLDDPGYDHGDFVFQIRSPQIASVAPIPSPSLAAPSVSSVVAPTPMSEAAQAWAVIQDTTSVAVLEAYIRQFDNTPYGSMARVRLEELKKKQLALATPSPPSEPQSRPGNAPVPQSAPPQPLDDVAWDFIKDTKNTAQLHRFLEQFPNSTHRTEATEKLAILEQPPGRVSALPADIARQLQLELRRVGCFTSEADGDWNDRSRRAIELFNKHGGANLDPKLASIDALDIVRSRQSRICPLTCEKSYHAEGERCVATVCKSGYEIGNDGSCACVREGRRHHPRTSQDRYGQW
ncbi:MAG: caspase family protein, partial [Bradyrhizobiaceae bacterium]|nr:caspase family protein [Bradyrhizobiaceae bacterium]